MELSRILSPAISTNTDTPNKSTQTNNDIKSRLPPFSILFNPSTTSTHKRTQFPNSTVDNKASKIRRLSNSNKKELTFPKGDKYTGEAKGKIPHGYGTMLFANNDKYKGQSQNGKWHGRGTLSLANGNKYEGQWQDGKWHGQGTLILADGAKYEGHWQNGKRHAYGVATYVNGDRYKGHWQNGKKQGDGIAILANGKRYKELWQDGKLIRHVQSPDKVNEKQAIEN